MGEDAGLVHQAGGFQLVERHGRTFYPVFLNANLLERLGENLLDATDSVPNQIDVLFLFRGAEPLELAIRATELREVKLVPRPERPAVSNRLYQRWWRGYNAVARRQATSGDHPPLVYTYLTSMLSQRLTRRTPVLSQIVEPESEGWQQSLELLVGVEKLRNAAVRATMTGRSAVAETADRPLPPAPNWAARVVDEPAGEVAVEPLAMHVPEECFYIRFATFANYLWFRHLSREYGGDLGRMVTLRGSDAQVDQRIQQQMAVKETVLMDLFGDKVASEVALIGRDLFFREGSAFGTLLVARTTSRCPRR